MPETFRFSNEIVKYSNLPREHSKSLGLFCRFVIRWVEAQLGENGKREVLLQPTRPSFDAMQSCLFPLESCTPENSMLWGVLRKEPLIFGDTHNQENFWKWFMWIVDATDLFGSLNLETRHGCVYHQVVRYFSTQGKATFGWFWPLLMESGK